MNSIGSRVLNARQASGLSTRALGQLAGVSAMSISKYENGKATPSSDVLLRLAKALGVRTEYFFRKKSVELHELEFRKHPKLARKLQQRIEAHALDQVERFLELLDRFPSAPVSRFALPAFKLKRIDELDQIEDIAERMRRHWGLGLNPIPDLSDLLEQQGVRVFQSDLAGEDDQFSGLAAQADGMPVIVISSKHPGDRQRFTLAHELGHLVLAKLELDESLDSEKCANRFAGAFLVPRKVALDRLGKSRTWLEPRELWLLKMEYGLSMGGWVHRARDIAVISHNKYRSIWKQFQDEGWDKSEPFEPYGQETPRLMETLVLRALAEQLVSESKAAELMGMTMFNFRERMSPGHGAARRL